MQIGIFVSLNTKILFKMKKIILSLLAIGALIVTSCSSDPCKDKTRATTCSGKGTPTASGSACACVCDTGYSGTNCSVQDITSAIGSYSLVSTALLGTSTNARTGTTVISADGSSNTKVKITNLNQFFGCTNGGSTSDVICYAYLINGEMVLDETSQCGYSFKGKGVKQTSPAGSWKFTYTATSGASVYTCESTITK